MSDRIHIAEGSVSSPCSENSLEALHAYLDGELPVSAQPELFKHLADCRNCRKSMEAVLVFRRMSRQEYLALPPSADETFFQRLSRLKELSDRFDRSEDRKPLWNMKRSVSLRSALILAGIVFLVGLILPMPARTEYATALIQMEVERVQFEPSDSVVLVSHLYHMIDGPTVEADRAEPSSTENP